MKLQKTPLILLTLAAIASAILLWVGISGNLEIAKQPQLLFNQITTPSAEGQEIFEGNSFQYLNTFLSTVFKYSGFSQQSRIEQS